MPRQIIIGRIPNYLQQKYNLGHEASATVEGSVIGADLSVKTLNGHTVIIPSREFPVLEVTFRNVETVSHEQLH
jgi:hypothetical protein